MGFFNKLTKSKGGYIFLSHSHEDIDKVRTIRNCLEQDGFEPLCFYLKCLNDDSEIEDLIKREIDAREWFVFVDSENSRKSKWVTLEREYIASTNSKKIITIDIHDEESIEKAVYKIIHNLRIFISYSSRDMKLARRIKDKLEAKDYLVFFAPDSIPPGASYAKAITTALAEASQEGCVLVLLTQESLKSAWVFREVERAIESGGTIVPVTVGDVKLTDVFEYFLCEKQIYKLSETPADEEIDKLIDALGYSIMAK